MHEDQNNIDYQNSYSVYYFLHNTDGQMNNENYTIKTVRYQHNVASYCFYEKHLPLKL